jgi:hypothetical protein
MSSKLKMSSKLNEREFWIFQNAEDVSESDVKNQLVKMVPNLNFTKTCIVFAIENWGKVCCVASLHYDGKKSNQYILELKSCIDPECLPLSITNLSGAYSMECGPFGENLKKKLLDDATQLLQYIDNHFKEECCIIKFEKRSHGAENSWIFKLIERVWKVKPKLIQDGCRTPLYCTTIDLPHQDNNKKKIKLGL